eukprot:Hpha_TRINITY_DN15384_c3_g4::TRINITY_DN15384_c3_g4_i1::g.88064::m.88064
MGGWCNWRWLVRHGDTPDEAKIKTAIFPFTLFIFLVILCLISNQLQSTNPQMLSVVGYIIYCFSMLFFMGGVVTNAVRPGYLLDVWLVLCTVAMCALDLSEATLSWTFRSWAFVVLVLCTVGLCAMDLSRATRSSPFRAWAFVVLL